MTTFLSNFFASFFGDNVILATILISILPVIELRAGIPFGTNSAFWGELALSNWQSFGWSLLGTSLIVPIIALIFIPILNLLKRIRIFNKLAYAIENRVKSKSEKIEGAEEKCKNFSRGYWKKVLGIFVFVSIPLPFTGVWTGTCIAVFIGLDYLSTCISVICGNVVAGLLITLILQVFPWLNDWLFYIFLILVLVFVLYELIRHFLKKKPKENNSSNQESTD